MAGSIKGIIVEIGGDTSGLQKALSKVNSASSSLSKELRGINSLLKLDPKNTELLTQKQTVLNQQISTTEDKLKKLEQIKNEADKKMSEGTQINEENYRSLQREIINTQNKLSNFKNEASKWNKTGTFLTNLGTELTSIGTQIDNLGSKLTTRVSLPIVAGFGLMTKSAIENETAMQQVGRIYGDASDSIKDFAENQAINYNMSSGDAYKYSQIYGNLIQSITDDQNENADNTQKLLKASSIIASATGRTMEDVMDRVRSGLLGNTEAIEDLGVNVNVSLLESTDAFKKFAGDKSWNQLDFQTQQQIRLMGILEQTSKKYGDEVNNNTASSIQQLTAKTKNLSANLGNKLLPIATKLIDKANKLVDKFGDLSDSEQENIIKIGLMVAVAGPALKIAGTAITTVGKVSKGIGTLTTAVGLAKNGIGDATGASANLAKMLQGMASPVGIATTAITIGVGIIIAEMAKAEAQTRQKLETMGQSASDFYNGIQTAEGYLDSFNTTLFATSEEQENLQKQMDEVQLGITQICKTASDERRGYTQEEITQLDEYFAKLRELKNREIEIQQSIAGAITQQAVTNAQTFQGSLEEYQVQSQQWISTAQQQAQKTIDIINQSSIEEVALLNQKYGDQATMQNEAYATEYNNIIAQKQEKIDLANQEVADVASAYTQGYTNRAIEQESFYGKIQQYNTDIEAEQQRHTDDINKIEDGHYSKSVGKHRSIESENIAHKAKSKQILDEMCQNMSDSEAEQLGVWLAQLANTEMYGGEISEENQAMVDTILASYDEMPKKTKEAMNNAMSPMLTEMENKEPSLFSKATGIADGILSRLKKSFDINSPSKKTKEIFKYVMKGAEIGLEDEEKALYKQTDDISKNLINKFNGMSAEVNMGKLNQQVVDQTKTVFTTPQMVFNLQKMDEANLNTVFNYVNRRLGSQY